jgi:hypothetical protein
MDDKKITKTKPADAEKTSTAAPPADLEERSFSEGEDAGKPKLSGSKRNADDAEGLDDGDGDDDMSARKLEQRRAYNRKCAAKARKRSKDLIAHLQTQVEDLTKDKTELQRSNDVMRAQLELLENQNRTLMMSQRQTIAAPQPSFGGAGASPFMMGNMGAGGYGGGNLQLLDALAAQGRLPPGMGPTGMGAAAPGPGAAGMDGKFFR